MKIVYSKDFIKSAKSLPGIIQRKLVDLLEILKNNHFDGKLHTKPLAGELKGYYSFRITRDWRVVFVIKNPDIIFLIEVAHRKDIYR